MRTLLLNSRKQLHHVALRVKFKFMISKICYNLTDLTACELNNIDSGWSKISIWFVKNSRPESADLYSTAGEVKYANKYVLDFASLVCRSSGRCYLITVLLWEVWRDERSSVIIFKQLKVLFFVFFLLPNIFKWVKSVTLACVWKLVSFATFCFTCRARTLLIKMSCFHQHQGPGTGPPCYGWPLSERLLPSAETQSHARTAPRKICFKTGLTSYAMITHIDPLKVCRLKLWQFKATGSHNVFRLFQSKVSVLVPLHVYAAEQTRVQHISFGTAGEDNVEPWLV